MSASFHTVPHEVRRLGRLQAITLVAILGTAGLTAYARYATPAAPPVDVRAAVRAELAGELAAAVDGALRAERERAGALEKRLDGAEQSVASLRQALGAAEGAGREAKERADRLAGELAALRAAMPSPMRALGLDRASLLRFTSAGSELRLGVATGLAGARAGFADDALQQEDAQPVTSRPTASIPIDAGLAELDFEEGVLYATVTIQTDNDAYETFDKLNRTALRASGDGGEPVVVPLYGHFFRAASRSPDDPTLKTTTASVALRVTPRTRLELVVDADSLAANLETSRSTVKDRTVVRGRFDVLVRVGPLVANGRAARSGGAGGER